MNFYVGEKFVIVPVAGRPDLDAEALDAIRRAYGPSKEVIGVPGVVTPDVGTTTPITETQIGKPVLVMMGRLNPHPMSKPKQ